MLILSVDCESSVLTEEKYNIYAKFNRQRYKRYR